MIKRGYLGWQKLFTILYDVVEQNIDMNTVKIKYYGCHIQRSLTD